MKTYVSTNLLRALATGCLPREYRNRISGKAVLARLSRRGILINERTLKEACRQLVFNHIPCGGIPGSVLKGGGYYIATTEAGFRRLRSIPNSQARSGFKRVIALDRAWIHHTTRKLLPVTTNSSLVNVEVSKNDFAELATKDTRNGSNSSPTPISPWANSYNWEWNYQLLLKVGKEYCIDGRAINFLENKYKIPRNKIGQFVQEYGKGLGLKLRHRGRTRKYDYNSIEMLERWQQAARAWLEEKTKSLIGGKNE